MIWGWIFRFGCDRRAPFARCRDRHGRGARDVPNRAVRIERAQREKVRNDEGAPLPDPSPCNIREWDAGCMVAAARFPRLLRGESRSIG